MAELKTFRDLIIWQKGMALVTKVYKVTKGFPSDEIYGLTQQQRRSSVSIVSNIAEGFGRKSPNDFKRFLHISMGSLFELETQMEISFNLNYLDKALFEELYNDAREIERLLSSFIRSIN